MTHRDHFRDAQGPFSARLAAIPPPAGRTRYAPVVVDEIVDNPVAERRSTDQARPEDRLREAIVTGRFQPSERLVEADVARELGVGRSAVRTALARLEHEGLVEHERHRGARVRLVGAREAVEILETRAVLEGLAARHAASNATPSDVEGLSAILEDMRQRLNAGDLLGASDQNAVLHGRILEISGHGTAGRLIATLKSQMVRFQYRTILLPGRSERSFGEHSAIINAIAAGDPDAAELAMRAHLSHVAEALRGEQS
jgi:DNA-binding GntR family transcriptional regulator